MKAAGAAPTERYGHYSPKGLAARFIALAHACPASWLGIRGSYVARRLALGLLNGQAVDVERFGARMRLRPYGNTCEKRIAFTPHLFDPVERKMLIDAAKGNPHFTFIDIGANIGGYALSIAAIAGPQAKVLAVEPQRDLFERLSYNASLNSFGCLKLVNCALSDQNGFVDLFLNVAQRGEASIRRVADPDLPTVRVPAMTLMSLVEMEGLDHIDAIKIDVEGAEDLILRPFFETASRDLWPMKIVIEKSSTAENAALLNHLASIGYVSIADTRHNAMLTLNG